MYIYVSTNKNTGRQYVGQCVNNPRDYRIRYHEKAIGDMHRFKPIEVSESTVQTNLIGKSD